MKWGSLQMKNRVAFVVFMVVSFCFGLIFSDALRPAQPEKSCEEMYEWNWAFQQCLKFQPSCQIEKGHEKFVLYHQNRHALKERCAINPGDLLPESSIN